MVSTKKIIILLLFSMLFSKPVYAATAIIHGDNVNVRNGPGTEYDRIEQVHTGEEYELIQQAGDWVHIELENQAGWIAVDYITIEEIDEETNDMLQESQLDTITIIHDQTHIRSKQSSTSEIISFANAGDVFDVLAESTNWLEISTGKISGFIWKAFVEENVRESRSLYFKDKIIVIDPGHGGRDVGAIGYSETYERDFAQLTAQQLGNELEYLGANVISTRPENEFVPLHSRSALANTVNADAFLSIHYNSFPEMPTVTGIETFFYHPQHEKLATVIHEVILAKTGEIDRDVSFGDFQVIRQTFKPSVLLELGFISNEENVRHLQTRSYQRQIVSGIINGLQQHFAREQ